MDDARQYSVSRLLIGKWACFESTNGWTWAKIEDIVKINTMNGERNAYLVGDRLVKRRDGKVFRCTLSEFGRKTVIRAEKQYNCRVVDIDGALAFDDLFVALLAYDGREEVDEFKKMLSENKLKEMLDSSKAVDPNVPKLADCVRDAKTPSQYKDAMRTETSKIGISAP